MKCYAHSIKDQPLENWHLLEDHLQCIGEMAGRYGESFNAKEWAELVGVNHDLGKGTFIWQAFLREINGIKDEFAEYYQGHPSHAVVGAQWLYENSRQAGKLMAYCVAGHHGGMPNWFDTPQASLKEKLVEPIPALLAQPFQPEQLPNLPFIPDKERAGFQIQFFVRMLFSCLVDADFLDTERALDCNKASWRSNYASINSLNDQFWQNFNLLREEADNSLRINQIREGVLQACLDKAPEAPGLFSLTVPTGGGKTLASLAFALNHARQHGKDRIIYVIPFTSIIEQNVRVIRQMVGDDAVLEHHSNFEPDPSEWRLKLATENWDAPVVVTTNVQFFNSFYANKPSKCRKLHNVANSVIIFDEVQAIPVEKLQPCLEVIKELSTNYNVSAVLCTATQPAFEYRQDFVSGLKDVRPIVEDIESLFSKLKRTKEFYIGRQSIVQVANKILNEDRVLCIVNTRQEAFDIYIQLPKNEDNFYLSALMYPTHRTRVIKEIRDRLQAKPALPCRVVSTQLIEAGVDIDFPTVFRALAGIDNIAQAAGRCNRNGLSKKPCAVSVFELDQNSGPSAFRQAAQSALKLMQPFAGRLTDPECVRKYFEDYFWKNEQRMDEDQIISQYCDTACHGEIQFREIARFKMINSATKPIIIALEKEAIELVEALHFSEYNGGILRNLQKYSVQVYPYQLLQIKDWLEIPVPGIWVLRSSKLYSYDTGLNCQPPTGVGIFA